jgi:ribonuclease R
MSLRFRKRLLEHLKHEDYTPRSISHLKEDLGVDEQDSAEFDAAVKTLADEKAVEISATGLIGLPSVEKMGGTVIGTFRKAMKGFGFVQPDVAVREGSIFVPAEDTGDALSGDKVKVAVRRDTGRARAGAGDGPQFVGAIIEVVKRKRSSFSGELVKRGQQWVVFPDGREVTEPIVVRDAAAKNAPEGSKVIIELVAYPQANVLGEGVIIKVLGAAGMPDVETQAVIAAYDLPGEFPEECNDQAREVTVVYDEQIAEFQKVGAKCFDDEGWGGRTDLTNDFIITIDPPDAKDYDDAISIRPSKHVPGGWDLAVHIADVAHFIPPASAIDVEAKDRCNSVYLPRRVIPMIPELLSNGICSLQEGVFRFCKTAMMTYDKSGACVLEGVQNTLIKSAKRLTYLEAQALIDGDFNEARKHAKTPPRYSDQLIETLQQMDACAKAIQGRRQRQGMISLELPDVVLIYDDNGHVVDAEREDNAFTHTLIEMFMVEANEVLARLFEKVGVPLLRRTHPDPTPGDVDSLRKAAMVAGFRIPKNPTREELQALLNATRGTPASRAVHMAVLRTMSRAEYSPALIGHFALASEAYAHFTSPIRRYADLTVHRALAEYLRQTDNGTKRPKGDGERRELGRILRDSKMCPDESELVEIGRHATRREEAATEAERALRSFLVLQLLEKHIGESFDAVITGLNPRGIFIQIDKYLAEGFVKKEDLPGDVTRGNLTPFWRVDPRTGALVDARSGRSYNMGDRVSVKIVAVDLQKRQMECVVDNAEGRAAGKMKKIAEKPGGLALGGGFEKGKGAGFGGLGRDGSARRSQKSKSRDKGKPDWRRDKGR